MWKKGLVLEIHPDDDGFIRKARIKTATLVTDRPIHRLVYD